VADSCEDVFYKGGEFLEYLTIRFSGRTLTHKFSWLVSLIHILNIFRQMQQYVDL
jgi:hypothetical protein